MAKYNWKSLAREYISGSDATTLETMAAKAGYPSLSSLKGRCSQDNWVEQRELYRQKKTASDAIQENIKKLDDGVGAYVEETQEKVSKLINEVEMLTRHINIAKVIQAKGYAALQRIDVEALKPSEILSYLKQGSDLERLAMGLATEKVDIQSVSDEDLEKLAHGG